MTKTDVSSDLAQPMKTPQNQTFLRIRGFFHQSVTMDADLEVCLWDSFMFPRIMLSGQISEGHRRCDNQLLLQLLEIERYSICPFF